MRRLLSLAFGFAGWCSDVVAMVARLRLRWLVTGSRMLLIGFGFAGHCFERA